MATITRTLNPIPLEHLEPHRFEDLVRQLLYDFRRWRRLEATGRAGSDDGFDARGWEIVTTEDPEPAPQDADADDAAAASSASSQDNLWLIQCKREKKIGPTQIAKYVEDIPADEAANLHGILFAAACDFSKKARDAFRDACMGRGIQEWHLWGKAEIEDRLFQASNDHLLFAYFGFSLRIRKRSLKTELASRLATKRRAVKLLDSFQPLLIRDATDGRYPYLDEDTTKGRVERGRWVVREIDGFDHDAVRIVLGKHFAVLKPDNGWEVAELMDDSRSAIFDDPWEDQETEEERRSHRSKAMDVWDTFPESERAWHEVVGRLRFDNILAIDESGDETFENPQIYTGEWHPTRGPFDGYYIRIKTIGDSPREFHIPNEETGRIEIFERQAKSKT
jgi:hypothetical protein